MALTAYQAARDYVEDASARGVLAISPNTISSRLGCSEEQSLALLKAMRSDGLGEFRGYVYCGNCREAIALKSTSLSDLFREANALAGSPCKYCGEPISIDASDIEVHLSFFLSAVAHKAVTAAPKSTIVKADEQSPVSLPTIAAADKLSIQNFYLVAPGGSISMNESKSDKTETGEGLSSAKANIGIRAGLEATGESSIDRRASAAGKETHRVFKKRSALAAIFLGQSEEERHREGSYDENSHNSATGHWRVGIYITIAIAVVAGSVLLIRWLGK